MKISKRQLRNIILESLFLEGKAEDLIQRFPELQPAYDIGIRNPQHLQWIQKRRAGEPVEDVAGLVKQFDAVKNRLKQAGKSSDIYGYKTAGLLRQAIEDLGASKSSERRRLKQEETTYLGTFGDWLVAMPHTQESSCQLGKGTTWCTAATQSKNLFLSYVGRKKQNIILYYILKQGGDTRKDPTAKLSVGFVNGEPVFDGEDGGVTVDAKNKGVNKRRLSRILGEQFEAIMSTMQAHANSIAGKHPARKQIEQIAKSKDPSVIDKYTQGMEAKERSDFLSMIVFENPSLEIATRLSEDEDPTIRSATATNLHEFPQILTKLSEDEDENVRQAVVWNNGAPQQAIANLSKDKSVKVRKGVAYHPSLTPQILTILSKDRSPAVRHAVAQNTSTPLEDLIRLSSDKNRRVRWGLVNNPLSLPQILAKLSEDGDMNIRLQVASNPNTPLDVLDRLSNESDIKFGITLARNTSSPLSLLDKLSRSKTANVRNQVAQNPNASIEILTRLFKDPDPLVRNSLASNPSTPFEVLDKLSKDSNVHVRNVASENPTYIAYLESQNPMQEKWLKIAGLLN